jgi:hypothetical protein
MLVRKTRGISPNPSGKKTALIIKAPSALLQDSVLSDNEKLVMALCWTLHFKQGYNAYPIKKMSRMLSMHVNSVSIAIKNLLEGDYIEKDNMKSAYVISEPIIPQYTKSRYVVIPQQVYGIKMTSGAKLLWGEYNSMKIYYAKREYTAKMLSCTKNSVTNWTRLLDENGLLKNYGVRSGDHTKQKVVQTKDF